VERISDINRELFRNLELLNCVSMMGCTPMGRPARASWRIACLACLAGCAAPLHRAAYDGDLQRARALLEHRADVNAVQGIPASEHINPHETALEVAALRGHAEIAQLLIERGADIEKAGGFMAYTPLQAAAMRGSVEIVKMLLEKGAIVDAVSAPDRPDLLTGTPTLALAAMRNHADVAQLLVGKGADVEISINFLERFAENTKNVKFKNGILLLGRLQRPRKPRGGDEPVPAVKPVSASVARESDVDIPAYKRREREDDYAVVVGIEEYSDLPDASYAERDAASFRRHAEALGVPSRNIAYLAGPKAGRASLEKYLEDWLPRLVGNDSRVYFYFSGHGAPDARTGTSYLVPWDGDPNFLDRTGYAVKRLYARLAKLPAKEVVVILDTCFSGAGGRSVLPAGTRPLVLKVQAEQPPTKLTVLAAAGADEISGSIADKGHGTFTYFLLKGINQSQDLSAAGLHRYLTPRVQDEARRLNRDQTPQLLGDGTLKLR